MANQDVTKRDVVTEAIRASWSRETSEQPDQWSASNPAMGHCDVSSFVAWEHLGGDLVLGEVHLDGEFQEYHYWNRIGGADLDLTDGQFRRGEVVSETTVLEADYLEANRDEMRPEVTARIDVFRALVDERLTGL